VSTTPLPRPTPSPARVREVLDLAMERPARERSAFIAGICGEDRRLAEEVRSLLSALEAGGDLLEPPQGEKPEPATPLTGLIFGHYHIHERIGEGGMGVVYRGEDTRLGRAVAVKALPAPLARDSHRRARFEHEARILASLSHPNIAAIHGVEETDRGPVLLLEYVPGETLAKRLQRGPMPVDEAVSTAIAIARGLEAAHAAGVIHRDLKPSNIQLTAEGGVKILDFGVARQANTQTADPTGQTIPGSLIGTAAYMSPEQARGRPVDRRTDLWAFGCVLYAMLTGKEVFEGDTSSDTLAAVLRAEPDWSSIPPATPPRVVQLLRRCLEKDPDRRQRDAGDARLDLESADQGPQADLSTGRPRYRIVMASGVAALAAIAGVAGYWLRGVDVKPPKPAPVRFELNLDPSAPVFLNTGGAMSISPDGRTLVYSGGSVDRSRLYARRLDSHETSELAGTDGAATPCFSPDGRWIAFVTDTQLRRIPAGGGGAEVLVPSGVSLSGLAWDSHGIAFWGWEPWGLQRHNLGTGSTELIWQFTPAPAERPIHVEALPGGRVFLCTVGRTVDGRQSPNIEAIRIGSTERKIIAREAASARFVPPDRLVFWQAGALVCAPFDVATLRLTDTPTTVVRPMVGAELSPPVRFALSATGVLATLPGNFGSDHTRLAWLEPDRKWTEIMDGSPSIDCPRLSPDGTRIVMLIGPATGDIWIHNLDRGNEMLLTKGDYRHHPVWTPDSKSIVYTTSGPGLKTCLEVVAADGSSPPETLWQVPGNQWVYATDFLPDGRALLTLSDRGSMDLYTFDLVTREPPRPLMPTTAKRMGARMSADGTMLAYSSDETGKLQVYLHRYPSLEPKIPVSTEGGYRPVWADNDSKLFFRWVDKVLVVDLDRSGGGLKVSSPRLLHEHIPDARYDVDHEGKRLLIARPEGEIGPQAKIDVMVGWDPGKH
jgi:eukaryotic-like serine/threonine-protein kinase